MVQIHFPKLFFFFFFYSTTVRTFYFSALCFSTYFMYILLFFFLLEKRETKIDRQGNWIISRESVCICLCMFIHTHSFHLILCWLTAFSFAYQHWRFRLTSTFKLLISLSGKPSNQPFMSPKEKKTNLLFCLFVCFFSVFFFFSVSIFGELSAFINFLGCRRSLSRASPILV